ncbi:MAG: hypothetical protein LUF78_01690 [Clostridiales bacterium]|nr:hypothetical protein [Clostridiales bacterium]
MAKKPVHLHFTETDLADEKVAKAAARAEKAADKAEKANAKLPGKHKLRRESSSAANAKKKLRFGKAVFDEAETPKPKGRVRNIADHAPLDSVSGTAHREISRYEDDNTGVQAAHQMEEAAEGAAHVTEQAVYSHKLKKYENAEKLVRKSDNANVEALWQKHLAENPEAASNLLSRWLQKRQIKKEYAAARAAGTAANTAHTAAASGAAAKGAGTATKEAKDVLTIIGGFFKEHSKSLLAVLICAALLIVLLCSFFSLPMMLTGSFNGVLGTTYTAEDDDILAVDADYTAMETALSSRISNIESEYSGYDEYRYDLAEIGHNPFELASYLTVIYEDYTEREVQAELQRLFDAQYTLTVTEEVEIRTRTETRTGTTTSTDPETGETT